MATIVTCAIFATATGIVGAVVTLMGLLAFPAMLKAGYNIKVSAGAITAGGCLGILIPPSVMLIVYGATAGVSVVQLYAGAFFPGIMLAGLYIGYVIVLAKLEAEADAAAAGERAHGRRCPRTCAAIAATVRSATRCRRCSARCTGRASAGVPTRGVLARELFVTLLPAIVFALLMGLTWHALTKPDVVTDTSSAASRWAMPAPTPGRRERLGTAEPAAERGRPGLAEPPAEEAACRSRRRRDAAGAPSAAAAAGTPVARRRPPQAAAATPPAPVRLAAAAGARRRSGSCSASASLVLVVFYALCNFARFEVFKMLLASFFPLAVLILAVLGSIVFGLATPTEAAAVGSFGGFVARGGLRASRAAARGRARGSRRRGSRCGC